MSTLAEYKVIEVPKEAKHADEQMGSKDKFWYFDKKLGESLLKIGRPGTGEDWAEKVACELANLIGLAHAEYELAEYEGQRSVASTNMLRQSDDIKELLLHGNEVLLDFDPEYPGKQVYKVSAHTFDIVIQMVNKLDLQLPIGWASPAGISRAIDLFVGYLVFDAWIGNTDRHHENWASVMTWQKEKGISFSLAPTYDHASSLGCHLTDDQRNKRLITNDNRHSVAAYSEKARSAIYLKKDDSKPMTTFDVVLECQRDYRDSVDIWIDKIAGIDDEEIKEIIGRVPESRMSSVSKQFAFELLTVNKKRLVSMLGTSS